MNSQQETLDGEKDKKLKARIEAALYAAGRPLSKFELAKAAGITSTKKSSTLSLIHI